MTTFQWNDSLLTGNALIDSEHKELVKAINAFFDACARKIDGDEFQKILNFLNSYTIKHFSDEEQLQVKYKYPDYEKHKKFHETYKETVRKLMHEFIMKGINDELITRARHDIGEVIVTHIKTEDRRLATHIKSME
ncbi:MAG: hemerythrin family protein [Treponema sp.]|jgi:hemerythrin|nr:hemerythrin family protein [Treponema sp.]